jgi:hypothetical protein
MADESPNQMIEEDSENADPLSLTHRSRDDQDIPNRLGTGKDEQESSTSGMLREAIQKVMEIIEFHEREAKSICTRPRNLETNCETALLSYKSGKERPWSKSRRRISQSRPLNLTQKGKRNI